MSAACKSCATTAGPHDGRRTRGLCHSCYTRLHRNGGLVDFPTSRRKNDDTLDDLRTVGFDPKRPVAPQFRELAQRLGMTAAALSKAYYRAMSAQNVPAPTSRPAASSPGDGSSYPKVGAGTPTRRTA